MITLITEIIKYIFIPEKDIDEDLDFSGIYN